MKIFVSILEKEIEKRLKKIESADLKRDFIVLL